MWQCGNYELNTSRPLLMGILNVTPDSFSDGGKHFAYDASIAHASKLLSEGADIIDVGGESTRPGAEELTPKEELDRVLPVVRSLASEGIVVSIDTRHSEVAQACVDAGAAIINDISGFTDPKMCDIALLSNVGLVIMHMQGKPQHMQNAPHYDDVVAEVVEWLVEQAKFFIDKGVEPSRICLDPGPGFGKTFEHNMSLLAATKTMSARVAELGCVWMAAWSRKRFIGILTGEKVPANRVAGSAAVAAYAASQGANVLRVHDVGATIDALKEAND